MSALIRRVGRNRVIAHVCKTKQCGCVGDGTIAMSNYMTPRPTSGFRRQAARHPVKWNAQLQATQVSPLLKCTDFCTLSDTNSRQQYGFQTGESPSNVKIGLWLYWKHFFFILETELYYLNNRIRRFRIVILKVFKVFNFNYCFKLIILYRPSSQKSPLNSPLSPFPAKEGYLLQIQHSQLRL